MQQARCVPTRIAADPHDRRPPVANCRSHLSTVGYGATGGQRSDPAPSEPPSSTPRPITTPPAIQGVIGATLGALMRAYLAIAATIAVMGCTHLPWKPYRGWRSYQTGEITWIAQLGIQGAIGDRYRAEQARVVELEAELAEVKPPPPIPTREDIWRVLEGIETAEARNLDPKEIAEQLRRRFARIEMDPPGDDGHWSVRAVLNVSGNRSSGGEI